MKINVKIRKLFQKCIIKVVIIMNIGFVACLVLAILFLIIGIVFALLKEKGAKYVSGFRTLNHPEKYDKAYISRDMRNQCFIYFVILSIGAILSYFLSAYIAIPTYIIWAIVFFKSVHLDTEKAFEKYLIH
ncbi:MAG: DUF3784 domain-containing protein [Holdemanella biformis]|nr:DUF3784 domain-containing protein [Holdemanella biformis]